MCVCVVQQLNNGAAIISGSNILYAQFSIHFLLATVDHLHYLNIQLKWRTVAQLPRLFTLKGYIKYLVNDIFMLAKCT